MGELYTESVSESAGVRKPDFRFQLCHITTCHLVEWRLSNCLARVVVRIK